MSNKASVKCHQTFLQQFVPPLSRKKIPIFSLIHLNPTMRYPCSNNFHQHRQDLSPLMLFKGQFPFHLPTSIRAMDQPRGRKCLNHPSAHGGKEHNAEERGLQASQLTTSPTTAAPGVIFIIFLMRSDMLCIHSHSG